MINIKPQVSIVGAGPGDPELLTMKAFHAIKEANVIIYDALVSKNILDLAPESTTKIYVGKRASHHTKSQDQINELLVSQALLYGHVVRLKGGDPFVFGRGGEEMLYVRETGIDVQIIPGISSSIGVPGYVGIPVTHRGISESFWVLTATNKLGEVSKDIKQAAKSDATAVILMGLNKLAEIADIFSHYRSTNVPVAVIQDGTLPTQKVVIGTLEDIVLKVKENDIQSPAIIVIGDVVSLYNSNKSRAYQNILSDILN